MKIKICGLTSTEDAKYLNENKIDFAGFVLFFPKSKRNLTPINAKKIMKSLHPKIQKVAVVVSPTYEQIDEIENMGFDYIQIHGNISDDLLKQIHLPVLKAFNVNDITNYEHFHSFEQIVGYVFDAQTPGSGKTFDWSVLSEIPHDDKLLILAGGLSAANVKEAILAIHPDVVDVSSGVELDSGKGKDAKKIKAFVQAVHSVYGK